MSQDAASLPTAPEPGALERRLDALRRHPELVLGALLVAAALVLGVGEGWRELAQSTINGIVAGNYFALGAVGLTLIFGVLRLVNFAHGEFLTFGAYMLIAGTSLGLPLAVAAVLGVVATAILGVVLEVGLWRPVRRKRVGELQLLLLALGLAFFMRNAIAFIAGPEDRQTGANVIASVRFGELRIGRTELIVTLLGIGAILLVAIALRYTSLGRQARALADSIPLAETTGIDTDRIVLVTWAVSAGLPPPSNPPLSPPPPSLAAAVAAGAIGNAGGALAAGMLIGIVQEGSTLVIEPQLKVAVGFAVLILVLLVRPQGLFGQARSADR